MLQLLQRSVVAQGHVVATGERLQPLGPLLPSLQRVEVVKDLNLTLLVFALDQERSGFACRVGALRRGDVMRLKRDLVYASALLDRTLEGREHDWRGLLLGEALRLLEVGAAEATGLGSLVVDIFTRLGMDTGFRDNIPIFAARKASVRAYLISGGLAVRLGRLWHACNMV